MTHVKGTGTHIKLRVSKETSKNLHKKTKNIKADREPRRGDSLFFISCAAQEDRNVAAANSS